MYLWTVMKSAGRWAGCSKWPGQPRQSPSDRSWSLCTARRVPRCLPTAAATCRRQTRPGCTHLPSTTAPDHEGTWRWSSLAWRWFAGGLEANEVDAAQHWSDVVELPSSSHDTRCCILDSLQFRQKAVTDPVQLCQLYSDSCKKLFSLYTV